jgi:hypothetical protein
VKFTSQHGAELFEVAEEVLDQAPSLIKVPVIGALVPAIAFRWNDGCLSGRQEGCDHLFVGVIGLVGQDSLGWRQRFQQVPGDADVGDVAGRQGEGDRPTAWIASLFLDPRAER